LNSIVFSIVIFYFFCFFVRLRATIEIPRNVRLKRTTD